MARSLRVLIVGDSANYERSLKKASAATQSFDERLAKTSASSQRLGVSLGSLAKSAVAYGVGFYAAEKAVTSTIDATLKGEAATKRLDISMRNAGLSVRQYTTQIEATEKAGRQLGFTNVDTRQSLGSLITSTKSVGKSMRELAVAQDLARFKNVSLETATRALTMANAGSFRALKQLGLAVKPVTAAQDELRASGEKLTTTQGRIDLATAKLEDKQATIAVTIQKVADATKGQSRAFADTTAGGMAKFKAGIEDLQEKLGKAFLPAINDLLPKFSKELEKIGKLLDGVTSTIHVIDVVLKLGPSQAIWDKFLSVIQFGLNPTPHIIDAAKALFGGGGGSASANAAGNAQARRGREAWLRANGATHVRGDLWRMPDGTLYNAATGASGAGVQQPVRPGGAAIRRGYGGAGGVMHGIEPSPSHASTHPTRGLSGYPAFDYMASPGTPVLAPEDGWIVGHSGHDPAQGPSGDIFAWSLYFYGRETHSMYFMTHLSDTAGDGFYRKGSIIAYVANWGARSHVHVGVNRGSGRLAAPDRAPGGEGRLAGVRGGARQDLAGALGIDPFGSVGGGTGGGGSRGGRRGSGRRRAPAPNLFGPRGAAGSAAGAIAGSVSNAGSAMAAGINAAAASIQRAVARLAQATAGVNSAFGKLAQNILDAFDAINAKWQSPAAKKLQQMQAEDALKQAQQAYADAVTQYGANSPEAQAAARALQEAQLSAQAQAEQDAHDAKVKADRDALEKRLAELEKAASGAKTRKQMKKIQDQIQALLKQYGITPDAVQGALDWSASQTLFVNSMGDLKSSMDNLIAAINNLAGIAGGGGGGGTSSRSGPRGDGSTAPPSTPPDSSKQGGRGGRFPPEFASGGAVPIIAHAGEYVLQGSATRKIGIPALNYMNRTGRLPMYADGGYVPPWGTGPPPFSLTSAVKPDRASQLAFDYWRLRVGSRKMAKREAEALAKEILRSPEGLPTPVSAADAKIDAVTEALTATGSDSKSLAFLVGQLGLLKATLDEDGFRGLRRYPMGYFARWLPKPFRAGPAAKPGAIGDYGTDTGYVPPGDVVKFRRGGRTLADGLAYLHKNETVVPADGNQEINVYLDGEQLERAVTNRQIRRARWGGPGIPGAVR